MPTNKIHGVLQNFLQKRQDLLIALTNLCNLLLFIQTNPNNNPKDPLATLAILSDTLIEYIALGQFMVFEKILDCNTKQYSPAITKDLIKQLSKLSVIAVDFCDQHKDSNNFNLNNKLKIDLSFLSSAVNKRLELEDHLITLCVGAKFLHTTAQSAHNLRKANH